MKNRYKVESAPSVDDWIDHAHTDPREREKYETRLIRAVQNIERLGPFAGENDLKKLREGLFQTRVLDHRVLSTIDGNIVVMVVVLPKKKGQLSPRQLDTAQRRIATHMAERADGGRGGGQ